MTHRPGPDRYEPLPGLLGLPRWLLRRLPPGRRRSVIAALALVGLGLLVAALLVIPAARREERDREAAARRQAQAAAALRRERATREARPRALQVRLAPGGVPERRALVARLEGAILADARARSGRGELRLRYGSAACFAYPAGVGKRPPQDDPAVRVARLECLAVSSVVAPDERTTGSLIGQPFRARVDFGSGRAVWCKIVQRPGELSVDAEPVVTIARSCGGD